MARKKTTPAPEIQEPEIEGLDANIFSSAEEVADQDEQESIQAVAAQVAVMPDNEDSDESTSSLPANEPSMSSPDWNDFVMKHFEDDELDPKGNPCVDGLRRVSRLLLGPVIRSVPQEIQSPQMIAGTGRMLPAVVQHELCILWCRDLRPGESAYHVVFGGVADVSEANTDPEFCRFASATAATRAEAIAYRKALQIKRCSSEETTTLPISFAENNNPKFITPCQLNLMNVVGERIDVDLKVYINSGADKYEKPTDIPYETAQKMLEHLSHMQGSGNVNEKYRGYKKNWRD